ncbi:MAG: rod shape-determining protein MreC [Sulfurimicrobium sp.]|jgi:rod shape-determining protein MreC|nr:rod shape-determining protein MreC [Sulfurimicrobium sp.]MDO9190711.1 rod shape-determining protein MreC [Sulfurimicrobium sp.]MDP1704566.1 rod shape-determining protein MreC [Sulfurimicrobium sp.]MDP1898677.1 rod shape-determining protein MreC [Sulfurimicrobium sp.]MDP2197493.1 rod shape-determining protein MreC [Sulfurimicrobium sp.]
MDHEPFFKRGPSPFTRLALFGLLSIFLMATDARFNQLVLLRQGVGLALHPLQQIANSPLTLLRRASEFFVTQSQLADENTRLRQLQLGNAMQLQRNQSLQAENTHLRNLLSTRESLTHHATTAEVMSAGRDPFSRRIITDKGSLAGIQAGQAAIDERGLVGQVTRVQLLSSEITLITDKGQAVPVEVVRNGLRAIAFGHGQDNALELAFMPANMDIQNGDQLVTSGIDDTYPRGVPVAVVRQIERNAGDPFAKITCTPSAGMDRYRSLLIISVGKPKPPASPPLETPGKKEK